MLERIVVIYLQAGIWLSIILWVVDRLDTRHRRKRKEKNL